MGKAYPGSGQLSENFWESEFFCHGCGVLHAEIHPAQIELLQRLRSAVNKPLIITSGSRCSRRQELLREGDLSSRAATNSPHVPRLCEEVGAHGVKKYYTVASDVACFYKPSFIASSLDLQKANRDFVRVFDKKCRIGYRKYAGRNFLHLDVAYLVDREYIKSLSLNVDAEAVKRILASWVAGCEW